MEERLAFTVKTLIEAKDWSGLQALISGLPIPDIAEILADVEKSDRVLVYRALPRELASEVASYLAPDDLQSLIQELSDAETRLLMSNLRPDDRTHFLGELPGQVTQRILNLLSQEDLKEARHLLGYPESTVGRLMTPDYIAVRPAWTIDQALSHIRRRGRDSETINTIYVTDDHWKLVGAVDLKHLILAAPTSTVAEAMRQQVISLLASLDREQAVLTMQRYDLFALPVVDRDGVLLGIVTADDVMDVAQKEATEDFHKTAAVGPLADNYTDTSVGQLVKKRVGWLLALILLNLVSSSIIAVFERTLASTIALAFFIPLLIDSGGNVGSQSATLMIRGLATGDLSLGQWFRTLIKEVTVGGTLGLLMGAAAGMVGLWRGGMGLSLVVGLSMALIVLASNLVGAMLPFIFTRLKTDPAVASSPLITTVADSLGLLIYFTLAGAILK